MTGTRAGWPFLAGRVLGLILLGAAGLKAANVVATAQMLGASDLFPRGWGATLVWLLAAFEASLGAALLLRPASYALLALSGLTFAAFAGFHLVKLAFHIATPCSCLGPYLAMAPPVGLALTIGLWLTSALALSARSTTKLT